MSNKESYSKVILFVLVVSFISSVVVSSIAVYLKPMQVRNVKLDLKKNILKAAGFSVDSGYSKDVDSMSVNEIESLYSKYIKPVVVDIKNGDINESLDYKSYDQDKASRTKGNFFIAPPNGARVMRVPNNMIVYFRLDNQGGIAGYIFSMSGAGLWSNMKAFVSLGVDFNTINSLVYYEQKETAGLGAEVENPKWLKLWKNKKIFNSDRQVSITVTKDPSSAQTPYGVDALSGATLTGNGVTESFKFWFGPSGYGKFINKFSSSRSSNIGEL